MGKRKTQDGRVGTDAGRARMLKARLRDVRAQFDACQDFLGCMQGVIESYPGGPFAARSEPLARIADEIGWADNCQNCLVGDILDKLREIDGKLVEGLSLLGVKVDTHGEWLSKKVARAKTAIRRRRARAKSA